MKFIRKKRSKILAVILIFCCVTGNLASAQGIAAGKRYVTATSEISDTVQSEDISEAVDISEPAETLVPADTPEPTETPGPTNTPEPTGTPGPSDTPKPTNTPKPTQKPKKKLEMKISQTKKKITLRWNKLDDVSSYLVYTKEQGRKFQKKVLKKGQKFSFSVEYGKTYFVKMAARNKKNKIFTKTGKYEIYIPEKVSKIRTVSQGKKKVKLTWTGVRKAGYYFIYRKESKEKKYTLLAKRKKCSFTDENLKYNKNYQYKIISAAKRKEYYYKGRAGGKNFSNKKLVSSGRQKYSYETMEEDIRELKKKYYGLVQCKVIGKSEDGRKIYDVIIGNPNASKSLLVVSAIHAREYMTSLLCMSQIEYYLQSMQEEIAGQKTETVLKQVAIHFIPMANPDGVTISQFGIEKINSTALRAKLRKIVNGDTALWKANARGVDLNRNFPYKFKKSGKAGSQGYSGKSAASEAETKAVVGVIKSLKKKKLTGVVNYHATGSIIFGDCTKKGKLEEDTRKMYDLARTLTGYADSAAYEKEQKGGIGSLREYIMYKNKIPSITLEIGWAPCPVPVSEFQTIWNKNKLLVLKEAMLFL